MADEKQKSKEEKEEKAASGKKAGTGKKAETPAAAADVTVKGAKKAAAAKKTVGAKKPEAVKKAAAKAARPEAEAAAEAARPEAAKPKQAKPRKKKKKAAKPRPEVAVPEVKALTKTEARLNPDVFAVETRAGVLHEVVRAELASLRQGSASSKTRAEVRGGGAKPWRQKGTGRARAGSSRMPHWTGGGVAFGPRPRDYSFKVNRKIRSRALKMALSARVREGGFKVVDRLPFAEPKTAAAAAVLEGLDVAYPLLVLLTGADANAARSLRNLPRVGVCEAGDLKVSDIMAARMVLATKEAVEQLNRLGEAK